MLKPLALRRSCGAEIFLSRYWDDEIFKKRHKISQSCYNLKVVVTEGCSRSGPPQTMWCGARCGTIVLFAHVPQDGADGSAMMNKRENCTARAASQDKKKKNKEKKKNSVDAIGYVNG